MDFVKCKRTDLVVHVANEIESSTTFFIILGLVGSTGREELESGETLNSETLGEFTVFIGINFSNDNGFSIPSLR